ncbi:hypothetical protein [uncultured Clostridium sp.]|uniref:hypothetical protein n=1 Tax=uncultured Clostridium sp. TaxID=59620 RepID=UPI0026F3B6F7|nr:hypothetical protein [uncultured Clostridium sp.]
MRRFYLVDTITVKDFKFLKDYKFSKEDEVQFLFIDDSSKIDFKCLYEISNKVKSVGYILCSSETDRNIFSYKLSTIIGVLSSKLNIGFDEFIIFSNVKELRHGIDLLNNAYKKKVVELVEPNLEPTGLFIDDSIVKCIGTNSIGIIKYCRDALISSEDLQALHIKLVNTFGREHGRDYYLKLRPLYKTITNLG